MVWKKRSIEMAHRKIILGWHEKKSQHEQLKRVPYFFGIYLKSFKKSKRMVNDSDKQR